jgi:hypothetical protein
MRRAVIAFVALMSVMAPRFLHGQDRRRFCADWRVLVIGAHPDDEDYPVDNLVVSREQGCDWPTFP